MRQVQLPFTREVLKELAAGDELYLTGTLYAARDAAHRRLVELIRRGEPLPFDPAGQTVYYVGPSPAPPGRIIGAAGPTTSYRMDPYLEPLLERGLLATIGKGRRGREARQAMLRHGAVYLAAVGGLGALLSQRIRAVEVVAFPELGTEALRRMEVAAFPVLVVNDLAGRDLYEEGAVRYLREGEAP